MVFSRFVRLAAEWCKPKEVKHRIHQQLQNSGTASRAHLKLRSVVSILTYCTWLHGRVR
jgi:hypothetical protein